jgi:PAS domain-containing protein
MKRPLFIILAVIAVFVIVSFVFSSLFAGRSASVTPQGREFGFGGGAPATEAPAAEEAPAPAFDSSGNGQVDFFDTGSVQTQERLVIENADLALVVKDPKARMAEINALASELGGYVVSSNLFQSFTSLGREVPEATIVIRVPSERLDEALDRIKEGAVDINYENRSGQDVTNIYIDLQAQLKAKQAAEAKLLEIMDQATRAEDVLAIYLQVQQVQTEIEQLKGQIQFYDESVATSSISVRLIAEEGTQPIEIGPWTPQGAAREAIEDLIRFVQNFVDFLIRFVLLTLPALILIAIPLFLVYLAGRAVYRRVRRSRVEVEEAKSEDVKQ